MTKKIAIFVEGPTELKFTEKLIQEIVGEERIHIISGDVRNRISQAIIKSDNGEKEYFALIFHCHGDNGVKSRIKDNYESLSNNDYSLILGLRDLHPIPKDEFEKVKSKLLTGIDIDTIPVDITISVLETEAWFLKEVTHFEKIDSKLTVQFIHNKTGIKLDSINAEDIEHPSKLLNKIYKLVGHEYKKKDWHVQITVNCLDYEEIYTNLREQINALGRYIKAIDDFIEIEPV